MIQVISECDPTLNGPNLSFLNSTVSRILKFHNTTKAKILFVFALDELLADLKNQYFHKFDTVTLDVSHSREGEVYTLHNSYRLTPQDCIAPVLADFSRLTWATKLAD